MKSARLSTKKKSIGNKLEAKTYSTSSLSS